MKDQVNSTPLAQRSPTTMKVDNLLRRMLRVTDPNDPEQVTQALLARYPGEAASIQREREGLPVIRQPEAEITVRQAEYSLSELRQAQDDLDRDLDALMAESQLKDVTAELRGWSRMIRAATAEGLAAARFALDVAQRDRALAARRQLLDYARLARYVSVFRAETRGLFRSLAQSCDNAAALIMVAAGEALASAGVASGTLLLQASAQSLQERRDRAVWALRSLAGTADAAPDPNSWPRGSYTYEQIVRRLDQSGQSDLRALFSEPVLAKFFDDLIDMASDTTNDGLRQLGATALMQIQRLRRLIAFCATLTQPPTQGGRAVPESPALLTFLVALQLFIEPFENAQAGQRLVYIARPPLLHSGLYGLAAAAPQELLTLVQQRGPLAQAIDCFADCNCDRMTLQAQLVLDMVLHGVDRAIDAHALGTGINFQGEPERRATATGAVIDAVLAQGWGTPGQAPNVPSVIYHRIASRTSLTLPMGTIRPALGWPTPPQPPHPQPPHPNIVEYGNLMFRELCMQERAELQLRRAAEAFVGRCNADLRTGNQTIVEQALNAARRLIEVQTTATNWACLTEDLSLPPTTETLLDGLVNAVPMGGLFIPSP